LDVARLPNERARALFDAFRLQIRYDRPTKTAHCQVTISADTMAARRAEVPTLVVPPAGDNADGNGRTGSVSVTATVEL
jgi:hypothetical protein